MNKRIIAASVLICSIGIHQALVRVDANLANAAIDSADEEQAAESTTEVVEPTATDPQQDVPADPTALDPELLQSVWHPETGLRSKGVRPEEAKSYYAILARARDSDLKALKVAAVKFRKKRIENYRTKYEVRYQELLQRAEKFRIKDPDKYNRYKLAAEDFLRSGKYRYQKFKRDPEKFANYVDLFKNEEPCHGQLVTFRGHIRKLLSYSASKNDSGITNLYEAWIYTGDSQRNPAVVVCTSIPDGMTQAFKKSEILDHVTVTGYFFKMYAYESQDSFRVVPMLLAQRLEWTPSGGGAITPSLTGVKPYSIICVVALVVIALLWRISRRDRAFRKKQLQTAINSASPAIGEIVLPSEIGPNFENLDPFVTDKPEPAGEE